MGRREKEIKFWPRTATTFEKPLVLRTPALNNFVLQLQFHEVLNCRRDGYR